MKHQGRHAFSTADRLDQVEAARVKLARLMVGNDRPQFRPILDRLTKEAETLRSDRNALSAAAAILESLAD